MAKYAKTLANVPQKIRGVVAHPLLDLLLRQLAVAVDVDLPEELIALAARDNRLGRRLGSGRIVASELEAPNMFVNLV